MVDWLRDNRTLLITLAVIIILFTMAAQGMPMQDWVITMLRGLSVGALTFLVAAGLSIILGLMDVLNLAHGELFMIGAYVGWSVYVRPDTFVDVLTPVLLLAAALVLLPILKVGLQQLSVPDPAVKSGPWITLVIGIGILALVLPRYPVTIWDFEVYTESPVTHSLALQTGIQQVPPPAAFTSLSPVIGLGGIFIGGLILTLAIAAFSAQQEGQIQVERKRITRTIVGSVVLLLVGVSVFILNTYLTEFLYGLSTTYRFLIAMAVATIVGGLLGGLIEATLIRPLYERPVYQLMLTLGLGFIGVELVRAVWGRPEFPMPRPAFLNGSGEGCPATSLADWMEYNCATIEVLGGNIRAYNEIFIIFVGLIVLIAVWLLLQRTRLGMIIRAGVQDSEMVEAMGINVRQVFTFVFGLGVALAALGGVLAGPALGLSNDMGIRVLLMALIALAIGGLTSFPGAAAGSVLVGLLQQFIIRYGQIGINLPFFKEPFKPSPPLVPASTVLLMVIILLVLPQGLFGRKE